MRKHQYFSCNCFESGCQFCDGGLAYCTVCTGGEGELATECPGEPITADEGNRVYRGELDFKGGQWINL